VPVEARAWRAETAIQDLTDFHVGLVPLADSAFEQAKFPFKLLQYLALGIPSVAARVGTAQTVIEHGRNGPLAGSEAEWRAGLECLIADAESRQRLGDAGRETVAAHYTLEHVAPLLAAALQHAAG
jgi:glycosyltransferase involved in cell wall biosynthesis